MAIAMLVSVNACDGKHRFFYWVWVLIFWELENGYGDGPQRLIHNFYMVFANIFSVSGLRSASSYHPSFLQPQASKRLRTFFYVQIAFGTLKLRQYWVD